MIGKITKRGLVSIIGLMTAIINFSQLPIIINLGMTQLLSVPAVLIIGLCCLISKTNQKVKINNYIIFIIIFSICFFLICTLSTILNGGNYLFSNIAYPFYVVLVIICIGYFMPDLNNKEFKKIILFYILSAIVVSIVVYFQYLRGMSLLTTIYAYPSKNSISQMFITTIVFTFFLYDNKKNMLQYIIIFWLLIVIVLLRSRATIIGIPFVLFIYFFLYKKSYSKRMIVLLVLTSISLIVLLNDNIYELVINNILFANRNASDINNLTSGRIDILKEFPDLMSKHLILGNGDYYFECFYLSVFVQHGLLGGCCLLLITISPLYYLLKNKKFLSNDKFYYLSLTIVIIYMINGLFEGLAPFGPGTKCYILWLIYGIYLRKNNLIFYRNN